MPPTALDTIALFADLPEPERSALAQTLHRRRYAKGQVIVEEQGEGGALFVIESGRVKVSLAGADGREITLATLAGGDFFGEMAVLDGQPRSATCTALDDTTLLVGSREAFRTTLEANPQMAINLLSIMSRRLRLANDLIESLSFLDVQGRVARMLLEAAERDGEETTEGVAIPLPYTRQELANLVGTSRETLTRVLKNFERLGYLKLQRRRALIVNEPRLRLKMQ